MLDNCAIGIDIFNRLMFFSGIAAHHATPLSWGKNQPKQGSRMGSRGGSQKLPSGGNRPIVGASERTTIFQTIKFAYFPKFIVVEFPRKTAFLDNFPSITPFPDPLQNAPLINILISASLI